jgi:hypothetical protein
MTAPGLLFYGAYGDGYGISPDVSSFLVQIDRGDASCGRPTLTFTRE